MTLKHHILGLLLVLTTPLFAQRYTVSGYVTDSESGERLIGASVYDTVSRQGVVTNVAGFYTLTLSEGACALQVSYVGYHSARAQAFRLDADTTVHFTLRSSARLEEVTVIGHRSLNSPQSVQMSAVEVPIAQIKNIPAIGGEVDVLKAIQLLPGVQSGSEGSAGIYVRGGGPDENLITLDGVPLYNVSHAMGMFSVFNADAIKNVTLYKGNFPARFGSRLSSVIDVRQNDGNAAFWHGGTTVGLLAAKLNLEGPIFTKQQLDSLKQGYAPRAKTTFNVSARRTYFDLFLAPILSLATRDGDVSMTGGYYFYDINAKVAHTFSNRDRLSATYYMGDDVMYMRYTDRYENDKNKIGVRFTWGNILAAVNWEHQITPRLYSNVQASYTRYQYKLKQSMTVKTTESDRAYHFDQSMLYASNIHDVMLHAQFDYAPTAKHDIKFGGNYTYHIFQPSVGNLYLLENEKDQVLTRVDTTIGGALTHGHEAALFIEDTYSPWQWLRLNMGLRGSLYAVRGKAYPSIEPRLGVRVLLYKDLALKVSYSYVSQYIHLLSNSSVSMPTDLWVPITKDIPPMRSMQVAAGLSYNLLDQLEISVEGYYKYSKNLLEYKEGASFMGSAANWDEQVTLGNGWSYGVEVLLQRSVGPVTGWVGYTWSRTMRQFDEINFGRPFHAKYDREHDLSVTLQYDITKKIDIAATFVYGTGNRATLATQTYYDPTLGKYIDYTPERNNFRMPDYHRLDLGVNFHIPHSRSGDATKSKGGWLQHAEHIVNISIYNVYNRMNPYLIYPSESGKLYQISIFPILPSISYQFTF